MSSESSNQLPDIIHGRNLRNLILLGHISFANACDCAIAVRGPFLESPSEPVRPSTIESERNNELLSLFKHQLIIFLYH